MASFSRGCCLQTRLSANPLVISGTRWRRAHSQGHVLVAGAAGQPHACTDGGPTAATRRKHAPSIQKRPCLPRTRVLGRSKADEVPVS